MGDVLKLQANVPETIALEYTDGLPVASKFGGDQVMFSLCDGRKLFLAPFVASKIQAAGIQPKQPFQICKREVNQGNRRSVEYAIAAYAKDEPARFSDAKTQIETAALVQSSAALSSTCTSTSVVQSQVNSSPAAATPADSSVVALMKMAGCGAIDVVLAVEAYAREKGLTDFAFDPASIQDLVTTLFISMEKKAGRA